MKKLLLSSLAFLVASTMFAQSKGPAWLQDAVFYQIYPSSYMDSTGDGIGDLKGIESRLDYIKSLGVNALWLNPVFESGWFDGGYDVIDFYKIDPRFGTNTDMVELVNAAHKRGIKVCLDLVAGHTSSKSPWFKESASCDVNGRYADYYIWTDEISESDKAAIEARRKSPNPESSTLGQYVEANAKRAKYYLKNFYECQPALNYGYANPNPNHPWEQSCDAPGPQAVRRELRNIMAFWMDKGVDGFRVDMAASLVKGDKDKKAIKALWAEMRTWMDAKYPNHILVSEWCDPQVSIPAGFNIDFMIHIGQKCYSTLFFPKGTPWQGNNPNPDKECYFDRNGKGNLEKFIDVYAENYAKTKNDGYIAIPTANHDFQRPNVGSRNTSEQLKVTMTFSLTMPGVPFIYYGDEIGMKYQMNLPSKEGSRERAGTRTPMQWTNGANAGFSTVSDASKLYFPVDTENGKLTVETQEADKASMLNYVRTLLKLRAENPALGNDADWKLLNVKGGQVYPMVYVRSAAGQKVMVALNPTAKKQTMAVEGEAKKVLSTTGKANFKKGKVTLGAFSTLIVELQ